MAAISDLLSDLLSETPPDTLYHYTTPKGLIGIVKEREIWATHTQYLNDRKEYVHAVSVVRSVLEDRLQPPIDSRTEGVMRAMLASLSDDLASMNICVCSFSVDGDSLSQWRAYGDSMAGYAIGFRSDYLIACGKPQKFYLARCLYEPDEQREFIGRFLDRIVDENVEILVEPTDDDEDFWQDGGNFLTSLHTVAPMLKDKAFSSEGEWRLISRPLMNTGPHFAYRPGKSMVIPFYKLQLASDVNLVGMPKIRHVIVGPTPNMKQSVGSVRNLLASARLMNSFSPGGPVKVDESVVPYRAW